MSDSVDSSRRDGGGFDLSRLRPQRSFGLKLILVCTLAFLMAIPAVFVWALAYSRSTDAGNAATEVITLRGGPQELMGPVIVVPFERDILRNLVGSAPTVVQTISGRMVLYADTGDANARIDTELRRRGLHDVPVYSAETQFTATFDPTRIATEAPRDARIKWAEARVYMSMGALRAVRDASITIAGRPVELAPVEGDTAALYGGKAANRSLIGGPAPWLAEAATGSFRAEARLRVAGAQRISLAAFAKDTTVAMTGNWTSPSFDGGALPDTRSVTKDGFQAKWRIPFLARGAPGVGENLAFATIIDASPGATLIDVGNPYQSVERALKYAPMFIGLVFLTYFLFETTSGIRAHPAQYILVGLAQIVFYLLLLSISEIAGFTPGFAVAATATVLTLAFYAGAVFASRAAMLKALAVFSVNYSLIYVLLRMEDYALLVGSISSFLAIASTMWMTRKLDWYGIGRSTEPQPEPAT